MSTATKPLPAHGTLSRRKHHKCPCDPCYEAYAAYQRHYRRQKAYGRWQPLTDAEPVREHLRTLCAAKISIAQTAAMIGKDASYVSRILYPCGDRPPKRKISTPVANLILAISPATETPQQRVDATGTRRRLQALIVMGWPQRFLARLLGRKSGGTLSELLNTQYVYTTTAEAVARLYDQLKTAVPEDHGITAAAALRVRNYSRKNGWHGPLAWDGNIDDPTAEPDTTGVGVDRPRTRDVLRNEEIKHLAGFQLPTREIAKRVGLDEQDVSDRLAKWAKERDEKRAAA